jgi:hypothetical protein
MATIPHAQRKRLPDLGDVLAALVLVFGGTLAALFSLI